MNFGKTNKEISKINGEGISELRLDESLGITSESVEQYMQPGLKKKKKTAS